MSPRARSRGGAGVRVGSRVSQRGEGGGGRRRVPLQEERAAAGDKLTGAASRGTVYADNL